MEMSATFHISVFVLTVLIFSRSFATFGHRNSGQVDTETAPDPDEAAAHLEVKVAAEQDARRDINKLVWLGAGVGVFCLASFMGISGCLVGGIIFPAEDSPSIVPVPIPDFSEWAIAIGCISFVSGVLIPCIGMHRGGVKPPPDRLLDKPPEHVKFYTDAYSAKTRSLRLRWTLAGVGTLTGGLYLLGFLSSL